MINNQAYIVPGVPSQPNQVYVGKIFAYLIVVQFKGRLLALPTRINLDKTNKGKKHSSLFVIDEPPQHNQMFLSEGGAYLKVVHTWTYPPTLDLDA